MTSPTLEDLGMVPAKPLTSGPVNYPTEYDHVPDLRILAEKLEGSDYHLLISSVLEILQLRDIVISADETIRQCQSCLAMMTAPDAIKTSTVVNAYASAIEAETAARKYLQSRSKEQP